MTPRVKYAEVFADWLVELGYTHCFFVAGGNIMHLLDGVRTRMTCVATVHEVAAGLAAEAFNATGNEGRAFAMVTAGPGLTNITTALASAYLDRRELLVVGGRSSPAISRPMVCGSVAFRRSMALRWPGQPALRPYASSSPLPARSSSR